MAEQVDALFEKLKLVARFKYRASSLPRLAHCPAAAVTSEGCADDSVEAGVVGTAYHAAMAHAAEHGLDSAFKQARVEAISRGIDPKEVEELLTKFKWDPSSVNGKAKVKGKLTRGELQITGVQDLLVEHAPKHIEVIDYKTTRRYAEEPDPDQHPQLLAYGLTAWLDRWGRNAPPDARCTVTLAFTRLGSEHGWASFDIYESDLAWISTMLWDIVERADEQYKLDVDQREYQSGAWCQYCPGRVKCTALTADLQGAMNLVDGDINDVTRDNLLGLFALRRSMGRFESALNKRVRALVTEGGPVEHEGKVLEFRSSFRKPNISMEDIVDALRRCGADRSTAEAVEATLGMRPKVETQRLDLYKRKE